MLSKPSYSVFVHARKAFTAEGTALVNTMSGVASQWSLPDCCDGADGRYGQLSLVVTPAEAAGDELAAAEVSAGRDIADGLGQCDEAEYARRIVVAYDVLGEIARAETLMRRVYRRQREGAPPLSPLPHRHLDVAGSARSCAICATYGSSTMLMGKLLMSKLESIPRVHDGSDPTLYRPGVAESYLLEGTESIGTPDLYEMFGEFWWDTLSFAMGVSNMQPREMAELALLLPAAPSPFSGAPASLAVKWLTDAALAPLRQLVSHRRSWAPIRDRIVTEINQRARGSRQGEAPESLEFEFWRMRRAAAPRRDLVVL